MAGRCLFVSIRERHDALTPCATITGGGLEVLVVVVVVVAADNLAPLVMRDGLYRRAF